jgi:NAD+ kinase
MSEEFKTIGLIGKYANDQIAGHLDSVAKFLQQKNLTVFLDQGTADVIKLDGVESRTREEIGESCDLVIVIGGDGTLLNAARSLAEYEVPLVGVNIGHLGFLTDIPWDHTEQKLNEILSGQHEIEERLLLHAKVLREGAHISDNIAFNDVVVHKWEEARMLEFETSINGRFVNTQRSDGLIISTPTGSTAYALSGGGPILHANMHAIALVPICPHTLSQRPLVIDGDADVEITISEAGHARAQVTCDGQINLGVMAGDKIQVRRYAKKIKIVHPIDYNYFEILRAKLHWGEKL